MGDLLYAGVYGYELNDFGDRSMPGIRAIAKTDSLEHLTESVARGFVAELQFYPGPLTTPP